MFDNFIKIPHTINEASAMMEPMNEVTFKFQALIPNKDYAIQWYGNYILLSVANMLAIMNGLTGSKDNKAITKYYENDDYHFTADYNMQHNFGIIIHEAPSTRFNPAHYPSAQYMESAQEFLKQTPHHFLRIFTVDDCNFLYVWTNKALEPDTFYKLYTLMATKYNKENEILINFLSALVEDNIMQARKILIDFFNSDEILNREFEVFKKCLRKRSQTQIDKLERDIANNRERIHDYENEISSLAASMREMCEKLSYFKYMQDDGEDDKLFFKHLRKIPYIKSFTGLETGYIHLEYVAPLLYFSDLPAEKLIAQPNRPRYWKDIIRAIVGRKYQLITKCALEFNTSNFGITSDVINNVDPIMKHPHISRYNCFGNHRQAIYECAQTGDYIGAIEQITQAVLNLNFYDVCVVDTLCRTLEDKRDTLKTWRDPNTGEMYTTNEMLARGDFYEKA